MDFLKECSIFNWIKQIKKIDDKEYLMRQKIKKTYNYTFLI